MPKAIMRAMFGKQHSGQTRRGRHKRFHVARQARGHGYESYSAPRAEASVRGESELAATEVPTGANPKASAALATEGENFTQKGTSLEAARNGLSFCLFSLSM